MRDEWTRMKKGKERPSYVMDDYCKVCGKGYSQAAQSWITINYFTGEWSHPGCLANPLAVLLKETEKHYEKSSA